MIRKAERRDETFLRKYFEYVIADTFVKEGVGHLVDDIKNEVISKMATFEESLNDEAVLLVYEQAGDIIATGAVIQCSGLIYNHAPELKDLKEMGAVFTDPKLHKQGIGSKIVKRLIQEMDQMGQSSFCMDSGYTIAKAIWVRKFGEPHKIVKDLWGEGHDHYIWKLDTQDYLD